MTSFYWILLAGGLFGLIHSGLATTRAKDLAAQWFGERSRKYYRLFYSIVGFLTTFLYISLIHLLPDSPIYHIPAPWVILTTLIQAAAILLGIISTLQLTRNSDFLGLDALKSRPPERQTRLITSGLYARVRHPLYDCIFIFLLAMPVLSWNLLAFNIGIVVYTIIGTILEERKLLKEFDFKYREYQKRTPMFIPIRLK